MPRGRSKKLSSDEIEIDESETVRAAETEVIDFIEGLGPQGVSEVSLYRILANGKQEFIVSGPPSQFSEQYVQVTYGRGDYLVRAKLNGRWFRSKGFSVAAPGGEGAPTPNGNGHNSDSEIERLRLQIHEQQIRMDAERQAAMQRAHELQLAMLNNQKNGGTSITEMITAVKALNDLGGQDQIDKAIDRLFSLAGKVNDLKGGSSAEGGGWLDFLKPVAAEAGKAILPRLVPFLNNGAPNAPVTPPPTVSPAPPPIAQAGPPGLPESAPITPPPPTAPTEEQLEMEYSAQKREALSFALTMARMGRPPELWADFALERVDTTSDPITSRFLAEIMRAESFAAWFADLEKLEPSVITQKAWFDIFYQTIRDTIAAKEAERDRE